MIDAYTDHFSSCNGPCQTDSSVHGIGSVLAELHHVRTIDDTEEFFCTFQLNRCWPAKIGSQFHLAGSSLDHRRESMTQADASESASIFYVLIAIDIPNSAPTTFHDVWRH